MSERAVIDGSTFASAVKHSQVYRGLAGLGRQLAALRRRIAGNPACMRAGRASSSLVAGLSRASSRARVTRFGRRTVRAVRHSWLYGWLTADPEADVVVIDLRETWTIGPVIPFLERIATVLEPLRATVAAILGRGVEWVSARSVTILGVVFTGVIGLWTVHLAGKGVSSPVLLFLGFCAAISLLASGAGRSTSELSPPWSYRALLAVLSPPPAPDGMDAARTTGIPDSGDGTGSRDERGDEEPMEGNGQRGEGENGAGQQGEDEDGAGMRGEDEDGAGRRGEGESGE